MRLGRSLSRFTASRGRQMAALVALTAATMMLPMQHKLKCACEVQPSARRFAVAPYAGVLRDTYANPGDVVTAGQLLAKMDDREINWELSGVIADRDRARKEMDVAMSQNDAAKMQMSELEIERNELKIKLLQHRKANLEIKAAVAGVVLRGDLDGVRGAPVETGETLFEIAPLDQLRLDIRIREEDVSYAKEQMPVTLCLDALPNRELDGRIDRLHPQAEVIDGENVFVAEVELAEVSEALRPGMQGHSDIIANKRPLGWILFHRPWERLVNLMR